MILVFDLVDRTARGHQSCLLDGDGEKGNVEGISGMAHRGGLI